MTARVVVAWGTGAALTLYVLSVLSAHAVGLIPVLAFPLIGWAGTLPVFDMDRELAAWLG